MNFTNTDIANEVKEARKWIEETFFNNERKIENSQIARLRHWVIRSFRHSGNHYDTASIPYLDASHQLLLEDYALGVDDIWYKTKKGKLLVGTRYSTQISEDGGRRETDPKKIGEL